MIPRNELASNHEHPTELLVTVGSAQGANRSLRDATTFQLLPDETTGWNHCYDNGVFGCYVPEAFYALARDEDGNLLAGGFVQTDRGGPMRDVCIVRTDSAGNELLRFDRPVFHGVIENLWDLLTQPDGKVGIWVALNPDLEPLHADPRWAALMESLRAMVTGETTSS